MPQRLNLSAAAVPALEVDVRGCFGALIAALLPAGLTELVLCSRAPVTWFPVWCLHPASNPPGALQALRVIRVTTPSSTHLLRVLTDVSRPETELRIEAPHVELAFQSSASLCGAALHVRCRTLRLVFMHGWNAGMLGPQGLRELSMAFSNGLSMEICWQDQVGVLRGAPHDLQMRMPVPVRMSMLHLMRAHGHEWAFEASNTGWAWQRWPPADSPMFQAALQRHDAALQWAGGA